MILFIFLSCTGKNLKCPCKLRQGAVKNQISTKSFYMNKKKTKNILIFFSLLGIFFMTGCSPALPKYGVANPGSASRYMAAPVFRDTIQNATYLSGQFFSNTGHGYYPDEWIYFGDLSLHRSHTGKNYNLAYGLYGYLGNYKVEEVEGFRGNYSFFGSGLKASINYTEDFQKVAWRVIGLQSSVYYEYGDYARFRQNAEEADLITNLHPDPFRFYSGLTTEVIFKLDRMDLSFFVSPGLDFGFRDDNEFRLTGSINLITPQNTFSVQTHEGNQGTFFSFGYSRRISGF